MEKTNKKYPELILLMCMIYSSAFPQSSFGIENYNQLGRRNNYEWMPIGHYQAKKGVYTELRYNYDGPKTLTLLEGKTFKGGKNFDWNITPMLGFSSGHFTGFTMEVNTDLDWQKFYFSSQTQYSAGVKRKMDDFFFSWTELGYNISRIFYSGLAMQYTREPGTTSFEPGFVAGINIEPFSFPCYVFNPFHAERYFVLGLNYELNFRRK